MANVTLSIDPAVLSRARVYARKRGVSLSRMVETYLIAVAETASGPATRSTPILNSLTGVLRNASLEDHRRHLEKKYR